MAQGTGLLAVWMDTPAEHEDDLNRWYEQEHLPERAAIPGFLSARRYVSLRGTPKYMAMYDLESPAVLFSEPYTAIRRGATEWTKRVQSHLTANIRNEYEYITTRGTVATQPPPYVLLVRIETEGEHDHDIRAWYDSEHLELLAAAPGVTSSRLYRAVSGAPRYLAVYELDNEHATETPEWIAATQTEWSLRLRPLFRNNTSNLGKLIESVHAK